MLTLLLAALTSSAILALSLYATGQRLSPDGRIYLDAAAGNPVPRPFNLRPLLPLVCRDRIWAWRTAAISGILGTSVCIAAIALVHGASSMQSIAAAALFAGLPIARTTVHLPVLVDGPALAFTAGSALLAVTGHVELAVLVAGVGAAAKEHVPVFAALAAWSPWPLLGCLVTVLIWVAVRWMNHAAPPNHQSQSEPIKYARVKQGPRMLDPTKMLLPWGACLAALCGPSTPATLSIAAGYALLFVSADSTRIYQWGALPVCVAAALTIPEAWLIPAVVAHVFNPWQGDV